MKLKRVVSIEYLPGDKDACFSADVFIKLRKIISWCKNIINHLSAIFLHPMESLEYFIFLTLAAWDPIQKVFCFNLTVHIHFCKQFKIDPFHIYILQCYGIKNFLTKT